MPEFPKYVLQNKRLSKKKIVFIFRRNYLNIDDFVKFKEGWNKEGWKFEEYFNHHGLKCHFVMIIHSDNIFDMYNVNSKLTKVRGKKNSFGIFIKAERKNPPFKIDRRCNNVEFVLACESCVWAFDKTCEGCALTFDNRKSIKATKKDKKYKYVAPVYSAYSRSRTVVDVPSSVSWSARHPFQGGSVTPR